jgi:hypothetical protein
MPYSPVNAGWLSAENCQVADLDRLVQTDTHPLDCPQATGILQGVPVYDGVALRAAMAAYADPQSWRRQLMHEWAQVWRSGPGALVVQGGCCRMPRWWTLPQWSSAR